MAGKDDDDDDDDDDCNADDGNAAEEGIDAKYGTGSETPMWAIDGAGSMANTLLLRF